MRFAKIEIHLSIILLVALCAYSGFLKEALLFLSVFFSHELGHLLWIKLFRAEIKSITITGIGGMIELEQGDFPLWQQLLIDSGGIMVNVLLVVVLPKLSLSQKPLAFIMQYNQLMLGFNLLPIFPLDGFHLLFHSLSVFFDEEYLYEVLFYLSLLGIVILSFIAYLGRSIGLMLVLAFLIKKALDLKKQSKMAHLKQYRIIASLIK